MVKRKPLAAHPHSRRRGRILPRGAALADPTANPYLAFALLIYAGLYGIQNKPKLPEGANFNLFKADAAATANLARAPRNAAQRLSGRGGQRFHPRCHLPQAIRDIYCNR